MLIDEYRKDKELIRQLYLSALGKSSHGHRGAQNEIAKTFSVSFEEAGEMVADALLYYSDVTPPPQSESKYKKIAGNAGTKQTSIKKPPEVSPFATF